MRTHITLHRVALACVTIRRGVLRTAPYRLYTTASHAGQRTLLVLEGRMYLLVGHALHIRCTRLKQIHASLVAGSV